MTLEIIGSITIIVYCVGIFLLHWISEWFFNSTPSPLLDKLTFNAYWIYHTYFKRD